MHATLNCSLSCISIQLLAGHDHGLWSNGHQLGIDSAGPYPTMNYVNALPPTRYSTSTGYDDDPPHLAIVSVCLQPSCRVPFVDSGFCRRALQIYKSTEVNVNLTVTARPKLPNALQLPLVHLDSSTVLLQFLYVFSHPSLPFLAYTHSLSYCVSDCRRCPTTIPRVTILFLTI